jgi:hypothetical protein
LFSFPVDRWLADDKEDGLCALTLLPGIKPEVIIKESKRKLYKKFIFQIKLLKFVLRS